MEMGMVTGIDTAVILDDVILLSSNPNLDGLFSTELERLYGSVVIAQVTGTDLLVAVAATREALHYGERLFITVSIAVLLILSAITITFYRLLATKTVSPLMKKTDTMTMGLLKTQINAHFIINTIDCIERLSEKGENQRAAVAARNLAWMIRDVHEADDEINIFQQLEELGRYIEIMNIRHDDKFAVDIDVDDRLVEFRMLAQVLQPIVENALTHGLGNKQSDCRLSICGLAEKNHISLVISDNGKGMELSAMDTLQKILDAADDWDYSVYHLKGVGLVNIQKRIRAHYGANYGLTITGSPNGGVIISMRLPYINDR
jgi:two-component system sensor histidine kinase YesM